MIVTAKISKKGKMHVYIDGEYSLSVSPDLWYAEGFTNGERVDGETFEEFAGKAKFDYLYSKALDLLSRRDHSSKELEDKLARYEARDLAKEVVKKIIGLGLIDDEAFAQKYAEELYKRKSFSKHRIKMELARKGIERDTAESVAYSFEDDETDRILGLIERKFTYAFDNEKSFQRAVRALQRLGYPYGEIRKAFEIYKESLGFTSDEEDYV